MSAVFDPTFCSRSLFRYIKGFVLANSKSVNYSRFRRHTKVYRYLNSKHNFLRDLSLYLCTDRIVPIGILARVLSRT